MALLHTTDAAGKISINKVAAQEKRFTEGPVCSLLSPFLRFCMYIEACGFP